MRFKHAIGLEFLPGEIRLAWLARQGAGVIIRGAQSVRVPSDRHEARRILQRVVHVNGWTHLPAVIGLRGDTAFLRVMSAPAADIRPLTALVEEQLRQFKALSTGETVENFTRLRIAGQRRNVLMGFAREDMLTTLIQETTASGLRVTGVVPAPVALFNSFAGIIARRATTVLIHPGPDGSDLVIANAAAPLFFWRLPLGTRDLPPSTGEIPSSLAERWAGEIFSGIRLFRNQNPDARLDVQSIILCMRPNVAAQLVDPIARLTQLPVLPVDRVRRSHRYPELDRYAIPYGLALHALDRAKVRFCLLPNAMREQLVLRWQMKYWIATAAIAILTMTIALDGQRRALRHREREYHELRLEHDTLQALDRAWKTTEQENERLRHHLAPLQHSAENASLIQDLLLEIADACHPDDWITLIADAPSYFSRRGARAAHRDSDVEMPDKPTAFPRTAINHIVVEGYTPMINFSSVRALIEALRLHPHIEAVDLLGDDEIEADPERESAWSLPGVRRFALDLRIRKSPDLEASLPSRDANP